MSLPKLPPLRNLLPDSFGVGFCLCTGKEVRPGRNGEFVALVLQDATGKVPAKIFDDVERLKGEFEAGEEPLDAAVREFEEETGSRIAGPFLPLSPVVQPSGKRVTAWAVEGDIDAHITRVFENLKAVAEASGGSLAQVVKLNVFLTDLGNFARVNEIMARYFR